MPAEYLAAEVSPVSRLAAPGLIAATATAAIYSAADSVPEEWLNLVATPPPVSKLLAMFTRTVRGVVVVLETLDRLPSGVPALAPQAKVNGLFEATLRNVGPSDVSLVHMTVKVEKSWVRANSVHKWSVVVSRYDSAARRWVELPTKWSAEDDTFIYYAAMAPQLSVMAITGAQELAPLKMAASDLRVSAATVEQGQRVTISATVTNLSDGEGTFEVPLWLNSRLEAAQSVTLGPGARGTVSFTGRASAFSWNWWVKPMCSSRIKPRRKWPGSAWTMPNCEGRALGSSSPA
ncbi:MAG: PGF-pre-PGF domain-containing protein [Chloroflexota bacterium]